MNLKIIIVSMVFPFLTFSQSNEIKKVANQRVLAECAIVVAPNPSYGHIYVNAPDNSTCTLSSINGTYIGTWKVDQDGFRLEGLDQGTYVVFIQYDDVYVKRQFVVL